MFPKEGETSLPVVATITELPFSYTPLVKPLRRRRITTPLGMRRYLREEEGFEFVPRSRVVSAPKEEFEFHGTFANYLLRNAVIDKFASDHESRLAWLREQRELVDPFLLNTVAVEKNQFTGNAISVVLGAIQLLIKKYKNEHTTLLPTLQRHYERLLFVYAGENPPVNYLSSLIPHTEHPTSDQKTIKQALTHYRQERYRLLSYDEKLQLVHNFCTIIADTLWAIAKFTNPYPKAINIHVTGNRRKVNTV